VSTNVLTIAGTDPSGGAGIQADLKTFSALTTYGLSVITAVVAQNTRGVDAIHPIPAEFVTAQIESVFDDIRVDAVKVGMLGDIEVVRCVAAALRRHRPRYVVVDPVMVASSGERLLASDAVAALRTELLPHVDLITPNLAEAAELLGETQATNEEAMGDQLVRLGRLGTAVLLKGGHLEGPDSVDLLLVDNQITRLSEPRVHTRNTHGTGCTLSAAITALRPQREGWLGCVGEAKQYLTRALHAAAQLDVGHGHGPAHHFYAWWPQRPPL